MFRSLIFIPIIALGLAGCGNKAATDAPSPAVIDFPAALARAQQIAAKACLVKPFAETIGPILANVIDAALLSGAPIAITVEALAHQGADAFCAVVEASNVPKVGARRAAAGGPINYGTIEVRGKPVAVLGTPVG